MPSTMAPAAPALAPAPGGTPTLAEPVAPDAGLDLDRVERLAGPLDDASEPAPELVGLHFPRLRLVELGLHCLLAQTDAARVFLVLRHVLVVSICEPLLIPAY